MKKINFTSISLRLMLGMFALLAFVSNISAQRRALCLEKLTLPLGAKCEVTLTTGDLRNSTTPLRFTVKKPGSVASAEVTEYKFKASDIGVEFEVMSIYAENAMCYTYVTVADETDPVVSDLPTVDIKCSEFTGKAPATNIDKYITDCSTFTTSYTDVVEEIELCPKKAPWYTHKITRTWKIADRWGNTVYKDQIFNVVSPPISILVDGVKKELIAGATYTINETNCKATVADLGKPFIDWNNNGAINDGELVVPGQVYCGRSVQVSENPSMDLCPGSKMYMRNLKVLYCNGPAFNVELIINVLDKDAPTAKLVYNDYLRVPETIKYKMANGMVVDQIVYKSVVENVSRTVGSDEAFKITPLVSSVLCNGASISIAYTVADDKCSAEKGAKIRLSSDNSAIKFNGMDYMEVASGTTVTLTGTFVSTPDRRDPVVHIYATDACGNVRDIKLTIVIYDNVTPTSICDDKQISLTNNSTATVFPVNFSALSYDNCCDNRREGILPALFCTQQYIRRTTATNDGVWCDYLTFDCKDENVKVDILTIDGCYNYSICCVNAKIIDKVPATCLSPVNKTIKCTDPSLANVSSLFDYPTVYFNCDAPKVDTANSSKLDGCGTGTYTRTWTFTSKNDAPGAAAVCSQTITVEAVRGFQVKPMLDTTYKCSGYVYNEATERSRALLNVKLLDNNDKLTCSAPVVEVEKWEYSNSEFCKIIRIRYTFVDKCATYCTLPADKFNYIHWDKQSFNTRFSDEAAIKKDDREFNTRYEFEGDGYFSADNRRLCDGKGYFFGYERYIYINDTKAPTSKAPANSEICTESTTQPCKFNFKDIKLSGSDECDNGSLTSSNLFITWTVYGLDGNPLTSGSGLTTTSTPEITILASNTKLQGLALGVYKVKYSVSDYCGNIVWKEFTVTGIDCKTPEILVHEKKAELAYDRGLGMGMVTVCASQMLNGVTDNCTSEEYLLSKVRIQRFSETAPYSETLPTCITFTCADKGIQKVRVFTKDEAGNINWVLNYVDVQDNNNACSVVPLSTITGTLKTENNQAVKGAVVSGSINGTLAGSGNTDAAGSFSLTTTLDQNVQVKAVKIATEDKYAGVTTFDIARISKHLLDIEKFTSPYSVIAADVNKDGEVDATDMLQIRNFILRKSTTLPGGVWRFVDASYKFTNAANPFGEDFPEVVNLSKVPATATANFTAIKLGDVNTTYVSALTGVQVRNSNSLVLQAEDMQLVAGNEYTVNITADNFNAIAFQGTISMNGATVKSVKAGDLANYNDGNFGVFANEITTSWNGASKLNANVMSITFVANKSAKLSEVLTVGNSLTPAVANDIAGNEMNVNLKFTTGKVAGGEFALYQNTPNPVALETTIGFNLPKDESARLTVYSVDGKTILAKQVAGKAGLNQITINKSELNANGVMYYRLETAEHTATKKMVIIE